ncbi:MAG: hypothetical protein ACR2NM_02690 [Bythopirellula sp.]
MILLTLSTACNAALVSVNDNTFGANSFTRDTATGLEWLDINHSDGQSFQSVSSQLGAGGTFAGLRHATAAELNQFVLNAAINPAAIAAFNLSAVQTLEALVGGPTGIQSFSGGFISVGSRTVTFGMTSDVVTPSSVNYGGVTHTASTLLGGPGGSGVANAGSQNVATPNHLVGHWLVRNIPEPSSIGLLWVSGLMLGCFRRRHSS